MREAISRSPHAMMASTHSREVSLEGADSSSLRILVSGATGLAGSTWCWGSGSCTCRRPTL